VEFLVMFKGLNPSPVYPNDEIRMVQSTFKALADGTYPEVRHAFGFAGIRAGILIVDVNSSRELHELIANMDLWRMCDWEYYPLISPAGVYDWITQVHDRYEAIDRRESRRSRQRFFVGRPRQATKSINGQEERQAPQTS
jgi:hypothetical protein